MNETCRDIIALNLIPGLGPRRIMLLLEEFSRSGEIFHAPESRLAEITGWDLSRVRKIKSIRESEEYTEEMAYMEKEGIRPVCYKDKSYPELLKNIYAPPAILYCRGNLAPEDTNAVAIVGSRRCSLYGLQMAERLAFELAERGITVISGMARGIDSAAHRGALKAGGRTIAVMGSGFRHIYPSESMELMRAISRSAAVLTEYPAGTLPLRTNFPRRNRIISGMARGVVVVEAARRSGAMTTVSLALEQGREIFAVPGRADFYTSSGTNLLIQKGAKLVTNVHDILEELEGVLEQGKFPEGVLFGNAGPVRRGGADGQTLTGEERKVLRALRKKAPVHIDQISEYAGADPKMLPKILLGLEIRGLIEAVAGGNYVLS